METTLPKSLEKLFNNFLVLPGVGKRTAMRYVLHLLKLKKEEIYSFSEAIKSLADEIKFCNICNNITEENTCSICKSDYRDKNTICIVEDIRDIIAIENTRQYKGLYHVLGGLISPIDGIGPDNLSIEKLIERINMEEIKEIIFALKSTPEGETTSFYIYKKLSGKNIKFTTLAKGIGIGDELEYTDELTLGRSIINRTPFQGILM